jgi:hypothetical protein
MELVPCTVCRRHVSVAATACPFCAAAMPAQRARRFAPRGRITRAAVFSAALVGCETKQAAPTPAPAPQQQGSDDLEKLLDDDHHIADRPTPPPTDAAVAGDATQLATGAIDAGVPADAGVDEAALAAKREKQQREKRRQREERERIQRELDAQKVLPDPDLHINAKPYGAPPARRRVV